MLWASSASPASAQKTANVPRIGLLAPGLSSTTKPAWDAFREAMKELGYVEGENIVLELRAAAGRADLTVPPSLLARADEVIQG